MTPADLEFLSTLIRQRAGIVIGTDKAYLLENRLSPIVAQRKLANISALVAILRAGSDQGLIREVVEAMTTNETLFFRDTRPFELLRTDILPALMATRGGNRTLRIWSAACSTGQEPYSIAMLLKEEGAKLADWRISITATDLARPVLTKARAGVYSQFEVQRGLAIRLLVKYFKQMGTHWEIDPALRAMIEFREHNIIQDAPPQKTFDIIFCRNLLIYFDQALKRKVLDKLAEAMAPDAVLFLGGAESVIGVSDVLEPVPSQRGVYRRKTAAADPVRQAAGARG
ncbi:MAG: protein-glutamate O-methyltransferase CheR [Rhodospirillales bacterium]|nr:protein-glutamate O-methyltransferase CheR [Rhodospirillales bacterium]